MPVRSIHQDPKALTLTVVAEFPVPVRKLWDAYADPRKLERFWGPPTYPATFTRHDFAVGGRSTYFMTGPQGDRHHGYWEWTSIVPLTSFEVNDGFAREDGTPNNELPTMRAVFVFEETQMGCRLTTTSHFASLEALEQVVAMGIEEGTRQALGQLDGVLADLQAFAAELPTLTQVLSDTQVRISRVIRGPIAEVWRAHHEPALLQQWLLGPEGWSMPVCEVSREIGGSYRYEWRRLDGDERFGFEGELLASTPPVRAVTSERMIGTTSPGTVNELTLTSVADGTLLSLVITYPDKALRDTVLATGMTQGMEASYARLEQSVLR